MLDFNNIYNIDCVQGMRLLHDCCIDLTVTSPPYDNLRKYNDFSWNFEETAKELFRITKEGGVVVWVVGDATIKGSETGTSFRQALYFKECGFNLHDTMIYAKVNPIPQNHNRYEQCFEYMFVLSKGKPKTFNALREATKHSGSTRNWGARIFLDDKQCRRHREESEYREIKPTKIKSNIFYYPVGCGRGTGHPAVFPKQLATDQILSWSNPGDIVFDPFAGSGTTAVASVETDRKYLGFEISKEYCNIANNRISKAEEQEKQMEIEV